MTRTVVWYSCGAASAVAAKMTLADTSDGMMRAGILESFDPDWAAPGDWAAMYRAVGLQVVL